MIINKTSNTPELILSDLLKHTSLKEETGCMEWKGCFNTDGYARMGYKGSSNIKVHRFVKELHYGKDITGLVVRHTCDNIKCINPEHLLTGTPVDNIRDRDERGRQYRLMTEDKVKRVKQLLSTKLLSQKEVAIIVGIDQRRVSDINCNRYTEEGRLALR